jgi:hypothetical protein
MGKYAHLIEQAEAREDGNSAAIEVPEAAPKPQLPATNFEGDDLWN